MAEHPDTTVLDLETGVYPAERYAPESSNASVYFGYRNQPETAFPVPERSDELETKEQVFGLVFDDEAKAYPLSTFDENAVINDTLGGQDVVIIAAGAGSGVRAYDRGGHVFASTETGSSQKMVLTDETGVDWRAEEEALVSLDGSGQSLERLPSRDAYWFGWYAFYPNTSIFSP